MGVFVGGYYSTDLGCFLRDFGEFFDWVGWGVSLGVSRFVGDGLGGGGEGGEAVDDEGGGLMEATRWGWRPRRGATVN